MLAIPILIFSFLDSMASNYYNLNNSHLLIPLIIGFITSFIIGYIAIGFLVKLIENNKAYYAFDSDDELNNLRFEYEKKGKTFKYDYSNHYNRHKHWPIQNTKQWTEHDHE